MTRHQPPSREALARVRDEAEKPLSPEEFQRWAYGPFTDEEREGELEVIRWFQRRYPTPGDRLRYSHRDWIPPVARRP